MEPKNPDVLTDEAVMYRELGAFDKAIANLQKANAIEPSHVTSLLDLGIVYAQDLKNYAEAAKAWKRVVETAPQSWQAAKAKQYIAQLR